MSDERTGGGSGDGYWEQFYGPNAGYLLELYDRFRADPGAVDPETRAIFEHQPPPDGLVARRPAAAVAPAPAAAATARPPAAETADASLVAAAGSLATAIREYGHRAAHLDPLGSEPEGDPELDPATHGLRESDLERLPASAVSGPAAVGARNAREAIERLRRIYCATTGYDYDQVQDIEERAWLRDAAESGTFWPPNDPINDLDILERLSEVGAFERFLQRQFPGRTRFSVEGTGMLIPVLDEIIGAAAEAGTRALLLGMAHRGRLNVLAHVLGKPHREILAQFRSPLPHGGVSRSGSSGQAFTGDVTYHLGWRRAIRDGERVNLAVTLAPNPSHLEYVDPVVVGMARAADERRDAAGPPVQDETRSLPVMIHGDASFPGQGVVAETLNLSRLPGYRTGGTIHIIVNNQLGFTTEPRDDRSTLYASDLAKGFEIPIVHVNADDPEACIAAARLAHAYRERFRKDFLIDLIGYRRWGHNEGDDPSLTQPVLYARIATHPTVRELWAAELVRRGAVTDAQVAETLGRYTRELQQALADLQAQEQAEAQAQAATPAGGATTDSAAGGRSPDTAPEPVSAGGPSVEDLARLNDALSALPEGFTPHPRLERFALRPRREAFRPAPEGGERTLDWGHAELLAFATILEDGTPIRLTGQDTARGTFSQRHAVLHDSQTGAVYVPLQHLATARASFEVRDSPLSESACLGFEYGYSVQAPDALVIWEAQYGDFVNGAQVIVDQFIVSARAKWDQRPSVVLLLPHAYEGQGPEHSSARPERFLSLAAEDNVRVVNCTTAAQYFHVLRRQAWSLQRDPRPLIVLTPKSLLRHPLAASPPSALAAGTSFRPVLDDPLLAGRDRNGVSRVVLGSGKVYVDLSQDERRARTPGLAVVRVEELYPFPGPELERVLTSYPGAREVVWLQEEPRNQGAWPFVRPRLERLLEGRGLTVRYVGRPPIAAPAEGLPSWHAAEQARIVSSAFEGLPLVEPPPAAPVAEPAAARPRSG
jgi:2-oxoglutarate dehydrogenase E1 component